MSRKLLLTHGDMIKKPQNDHTCKATQAVFLKQNEAEKMCRKQHRAHVYNAIQSSSFSLKRSECTRQAAQLGTHFSSAEVQSSQNLYLSKSLEFSVLWISFPTAILFPTLPVFRITMQKSTIMILKGQNKMGAVKVFQ